MFKLDIKRPCIPFDMERHFVPSGYRLNYMQRLITLRAKRLLKGRGPSFKLYDKVGIVFIHIPKNAGSSIVNSLYGRGVPHNSAQYLNAIDSTVLSRTFSFAVLRDPADRFSSAFYYLKNTTEHDGDKIFADKYLKDFDSPHALLECMIGNSDLYAAIIGWLHFRPQFEFVCNISGEIMVDCLGTMDSMNELLTAVDANAGTKLHVPRLNQSIRPRDESALSPDIISEIYRHDYEIIDLVRSCDDDIYMR